MQAGFDRIDEVGEAAVFDAVEYAEGVVVLDLVELTESEVRERSRPDGEPMTIIHSAPNHHLARGKIEENEDDVHDRDGRLVEVIDVGGDEFSDLVNEEKNGRATGRERGCRYGWIWVVAVSLKK